MKKLFLSGLIAAIAFLGIGFHSDAHAADRVLKSVKVCKFSFTDLAADTLLTQANGQAYCDIGDMIPQRVVLESNVVSLTGTNVIFKVLTTSDSTNPGATTDPVLLGSDGSTALVSATITAAGRAARGSEIDVEGASGLDSNLGTKVGVWADTSSITDLDGYVLITIFGRQ